MQRSGQWRVTAIGPVKLRDSEVDLERLLEEWIEHGPSLLDAGLTIVGRQVPVEAGHGDLLGLDPNGGLVVIEIKRGTLRRDAVSQAIDYASCFHRMSASDLADSVQEYMERRKLDPREIVDRLGDSEDGESVSRDVEIVVVGTGADSGIERMVSYLSEKRDMPIRVVQFQVFDSGEDEKFLRRELTDFEARPDGRAPRARATLEDICRRADRGGVGPAFRRILESSQRLGIHPRPYRRSVMYTHPSNRGRMLFTVWAEPLSGGRLKAYVGPEVFARFYPVFKERASGLLGKDGWRSWSPAEVDEFLGNLTRFFAEIGDRDR